MARRLQKIDIDEPTVEPTVQILRGLKSRFEDHHNVKYSVSALITAAELSARFINDRHLPDKAIDVIDEAGAAQRVLPKSKQKKTIGKAGQLSDIIAKIARIPPQTVGCQDDRSELQNLERDLKNVGFGQGLPPLMHCQPASRSGWCRDSAKRTNRLALFLFSGPTGVGKTGRWPGSLPLHWVLI